MNRTNALRRLPAPRRGHATGPDRATVALVLERDGWSCTRCGGPTSGERGRGWSIQHRRPRGMGGTRRVDANSPANLLTVCGSGTTGCHGVMETDRHVALEHGWLIPQTADPLREPVVLGSGRIVWLTADGQYAAEPPEAVR